ncbi:MAG TPA: gluconate 2-dehydrogenase subunit 3 family protein [Gammaproteobacteria bacterium]|nr:gluconate 2-dehydrogenase subunit 3 family protein [Gammaproteobacteria bacterium]
MRRVSRREVLSQAAAASAASVVPGGALAQLGEAASRSAPEVLSESQLRVLEAVVARLIPSDANGPGALEAGAARYIDRALDDALADSLAAYVQGLAALDAHARETQGRAFVELEPGAQDAILERLEDDGLEGYVPSAAGFFDMLLAHTLEGTFSDPYYGGNRDFMGWDLLGYPGIRLAVAPAEQRLEPPREVTRVSAYDIPMFESLDPESELDDG